MLKTSYNISLIKKILKEIKHNEKLIFNRSYEEGSGFVKNYISDLDYLNVAKNKKADSSTTLLHEFGHLLDSKKRPNMYLNVDRLPFKEKLSAELGADKNIINYIKNYIKNPHSAIKEYKLKRRPYAKSYVLTDHYVEIGKHLKTTNKEPIIEKLKNVSHIETKMMPTDIIDKKHMNDYVASAKSLLRNIEKQDKSLKGLRKKISVKNKNLYKKLLLID